MGTHSELRKAAVAAFVTAGLLTASLVLLHGGPRAAHPNAVLAWHADNAVAIKAGMITWMLAMLGLVVFAVSFREALWASVADRSWMTVLFLQGASVFATIAVVSGAIGWALADQAAADAISAELAGTIWAIELTLLRFATWGFTVPLGVAGLVLYRHSVLGQVCAVAALLLIIALLWPLTWAVALHVFPAWLALAGLALLVRASGRVSEDALQR